jgi:hypothetical protein
MGVARGAPTQSQKSKPMRRIALALVIAGTGACGEPQPKPGKEIAIHVARTSPVVFYVPTGRPNAACWDSDGTPRPTDAQGLARFSWEIAVYPINEYDTVQCPGDEPIAFHLKELDPA